MYTREGDSQKDNDNGDGEVLHELRVQLGVIEEGHVDRLAGRQVGVFSRGLIAPKWHTVGLKENREI